MGAGAGKETNPSEDLSKNIRLSSDEMSCESCSVNFTIIKRKKPCCDCGKNHCSNCLTKPATGKSSHRRCRRCQLLTSGNFTRSDLMGVPTKELRSFLLRRKIPMNNCTEKTDLVDILLSTSNNLHYREEQAERQRHLVELQERKRRRDLESALWGSAQVGEHSAETGQEFVQADSSSTRNDQESTRTDPASTHAQSTTTGLNLQTESSVHSNEPSAPHESVPQSQTTTSDNEPPTQSNLPHDQQDSSPSSAMEYMTSEAPSVGEADNSESNQTTEVSPKQRVRKVTHLNDVEEVEAIEDLSVRQLKEILATSYVAYKGCCEKWELVERVTRLFNETVKNKHRAEELENAEDMSGETELCKICMDAVIDCVLLDCGHMVTCTQCGKQMAECPMCRQFVVRVVHVFKA